MDQDKQPLVGGRYTVKDGVRTLVEEPTRDHPEGNRARETDGTPVPMPGEPESNAALAAAEASQARRSRKGAE